MLSQANTFTHPVILSEEQRSEGTQTPHFHKQRGKVPPVRSFVVPPQDDL